VAKPTVSLDGLQEECEKLLALLKDRQPGLISWHFEFNNRLSGLYTILAPLYGRSELVVEAAPVKPVDSSYPITIDHSLTLNQMIALGKYDWVNPDITADRFPIKGEGKKKKVVELVHFNRDISSENAVKELKKMGLRPATIEELLAFGAKYPEIQRKFLVISLGSSCELGGRRSVACLRRLGSGRGLNLSFWDGVWGGHYRFLGVRD
jgi:hypothetical protein